jgi:ABC-type Fe3+ transport system permease subunit
VHHLLIDVISVVILFLTTKQQQQQQHQQHQQQEQQQEVQWSACYVKICTVLLLLGVQITALVC